VINDILVRERYSNYCEEEKKAVEFFRKIARFHEKDKDHNIILLDSVSAKNPPRFNKSLAFLLYKDAKAVMDVRKVYDQGVKNNSISYSVSLGFVDDSVKERIHLGEIMRSLNIGDGHPGAAAGEMEAASSKELARRHDKILDTIVTRWYEQMNGKRV
jgi:hypothetical protein